MIRVRGGLTALVVLLAGAGAAAGDSLSGTWELEVLQSEDKLLRVEHSGAEFSAYRQLHPMFEGKRYLLEHLYKGRVNGMTLSGNLLVREDPDDGAPVDFEVLRPFKGEILPGPVLLIDGKRARRVADLPVEKVAPPPEEKAPPDEGPATEAQPETGSVAPEPAGEAGARTGGGSGAKAGEPLDLARLTPVSGPALEIPGVKAAPDLKDPPQDRRDREFAKHLAAGDRHAGRGAHAQALLEYLEAYKWDEHKVAVFARIAETAERRGKLELARTFYGKLIRFDPENEHAHERLKALGPDHAGEEAH